MSKFDKKQETKYAIYDFCQTIVDFETADEFTDYIAKKENIKKYKIRITLFSNKYVSILTRILFRKSSKKELCLKRLEGINRKIINDYARLFYLEEIKPHLINEVIRQILEDRKNGKEIIILSASYREIIEQFSKDIKVNCIIANELDYDENDNFTGKIKNKDNYGKEKINTIKTRYGNDVLQKSISYSDSISDLQLLKMSKEAVVVSYLKHKKWVESGMSEIIWKR